MPLSNDNQDYGKNDKKNEGNLAGKGKESSELTTDDLKGKKIDADVSKDKG